MRLISASSDNLKTKRMILKNLHQSPVALEGGDLIENELELRHKVQMFPESDADRKHVLF